MRFHIQVVDDRDIVENSVVVDRDVVDGDFFLTCGLVSVTSK